MKQIFAHLILCVLFSLHDDTNEKIYPISCLHPYNEHCIRLKSIKNNDLAEFNWKHYRKGEIPNLKFIIRNKIFEILNTYGILNPMKYLYNEIHGQKWTLRQHSKKYNPPTTHLTKDSITTLTG